MCAQTLAQRQGCTHSITAEQQFPGQKQSLGLQAFHHLPSPGASGRRQSRQQDPCTLTQPAFKGLTQLCFLPLPLFSPSWATLSSLVAS